jgi:hypothetical protein
VHRGVRAEDLLAGPRGRRLCLSAARSAEPAELAQEADELRMLALLAEAVDAAAYWQPPDEEDVAAEAPEAREELLPIAQERQAASRAAESSAPWSGPWWSSPANSGLPRTRRALDGLGSVGLVLEEDGFGEAEAGVIPVRARDGLRVREIRGPEDWTALVAAHPLDVSLSRGHDWWRATGQDGPWFIPDWESVAADVDAVHLTILGYLTTAGRALPMGDAARTVLAGWNPDETFWLTDALVADGGPASWSRAGRRARWVPARMAG